MSRPRPVTSVGFTDDDAPESLLGRRAREGGAAGGGAERVAEGGAVGAARGEDGEAARRVVRTGPRRDFLSGQPYDHLNVIGSFLGVRDVARLARVSKGLAHDIPRPSAAALEHANAALDGALVAFNTQLRHEFPRLLPSLGIDPGHEVHRRLWALLRAHVTPGVTVVRLGFEILPGGVTRGRWLPRLLGDAHIRFVVERCGPTLRVLSLGDATLHRNISTDVFRIIAAGCPNLLSLNARSTVLRSTCVRELARGCPLLRSLDLSHTIVADSAETPAFGALTELRSLNLEHSGLEDVHLAGLVGCPRLESLNLAHLFIYTPLALRIIRGCPMLRVLDLSRGSPPAAAVFDAIAAHCPHLTSLQIGPSRPTEAEPVNEALRVMARRCPQLSSLRLISVPVHGVTLLALATDAIALRELSLPASSLSPVDRETLARLRPDLAVPNT